jgi:hypothetical protein
MEFNLWIFLTVATLCLLILMLGIIYVGYQEKMKKLEIERQKIEQTNLQHEVADAVEREYAGLVSRIEVLEAIVTEENYDLSEKITRLK